MATGPYSSRLQSNEERTSTEPAQTSEPEYENASAENAGVEPKTSMAQAFQDMGAEALQRGRYNLAIGHFKDALRLNPNSVEAIRNLGTAYLKAGKLKEAKVYLTKALKLRPTDKEAQKNLAALNAAVLPTV